MPLDTHLSSRDFDPGRSSTVIGKRLGASRDELVRIQRSSSELWSVSTPCPDQFFAAREEKGLSLTDHLLSRSVQRMWEGGPYDELLAADGKLFERRSGGRRCDPAD